jgi:HEAT repeat protein
MADELRAGDISPERVKLRVYLAVALGMFEVDEGLAELIDAARLERDLTEIEVRKAAIEAIARRADASDQQRHKLQENRQVLAVLQEAARQQSDQPDRRELDGQLRLRAAYALGVIGGETARQTLAGMLTDADASVRYNAATGLARLGDARAVPRLVEMLGVRSREPDDAEPPQNDRALDEMEATSVLQNALRASVQLAHANPSLDRQPLISAIARLHSDEHLSPAVRRGIEFEVRTALEHFPLP